MILRDGQKWACRSCITGHRSSKCTHQDRELFAIAKKGRPSNLCKACQDEKNGLTAVDMYGKPLKCSCPPAKQRRSKPVVSKTKKVEDSQRDEGKDEYGNAKRRRSDASTASNASGVQKTADPTQLLLERYYYGSSSDGGFHSSSSSAASSPSNGLPGFPESFPSTLESQQPAFFDTAVTKYPSMTGVDFDATPLAPSPSHSHLAHPQAGQNLWHTQAYPGTYSTPVPRPQVRQQDDGSQPISHDSQQYTSMFPYATSSANQDSMQQHQSIAASATYSSSAYASSGSLSSGSYPYQREYTTSSSSAPEGYGTSSSSASSTDSLQNSAAAAFARPGGVRYHTYPILEGSLSTNGQDPQPITQQYFINGSLVADTQPMQWNGGSANWFTGGMRNSPEMYNGAAASLSSMSHEGVTPRATPMDNIGGSNSAPLSGNWTTGANPKSSWQASPYLMHTSAGNMRMSSSAPPAEAARGNIAAPAPLHPDNSSAALIQGDYSKFMAKVPDFSLRMPDSRKRKPFDVSYVAY